MHDVRLALMEEIMRLVKTRFPDVRVTRSDYPAGRYPGDFGTWASFIVYLSEDNPYGFIRINFEDETVCCNADGDYRPINNFEYSDPDLIDLIMLFVTLLHRAKEIFWKGGEIINLRLFANEPQLTQARIAQLLSDTGHSLPHCSNNHEDVLTGQAQMP